MRIWSDNPRNSEGDFIQLKDGKILFVYSHYDGKSSGDHASAYLAGRYSAIRVKKEKEENYTS